MEAIRRDPVNDPFYRPPACIVCKRPVLGVSEWLAGLRVPLRCKACRASWEEKMRDPLKRA